MGILDEIISKKKDRIAFVKSKAPLRDIKDRILQCPPTLDFRREVKRKNDSIRLIAEVKKASPSKGLIRPDFDPAYIASIYKDRADAISVLTEEDFFMGSPDYIKVVKETAQRPILRKDFIIDEYQIYESRTLGADAILLIERILERSQAKEWLHMSEELGLSVLFEVHDFKGLENAHYIDAPIIGINNRNLDTMTISLETTFKMKKEIPAGRVVVSESGIKTNDDVKALNEAGIDAMLIGTAFMEATDIAGKMDGLMGRDG